jgi:hypothetical protein
MRSQALKYSTVIVFLGIIHLPVFFNTVFR